MSADAIDYLERRVKQLWLEQPQTVEGRVARDAAIHELNNCIFGLMIQSLNELKRGAIEMRTQ